jgi:hypothetical protein
VHVEEVRWTRCAREEPQDLRGVESVVHAGERWWYYSSEPRRCLLGQVGLVVITSKARMQNVVIKSLHAERGHQLYPVRAARDVRTCG